jgi:heat shock protein HslJ
MAQMNVQYGLIGALALTGLSACQPLPAASEPTPAEQVYIASGNEPGWILKMDGTTIDYQGDYGETKIRVAAPEARPSSGGIRYVSDRITVDILYANCADGMSGRRFADTVTVTADGKQVSGCGGRPLPPETLNQTSWTISMIDQSPVPGDIQTEVRFDNGRISGTAGCNRFSGDYSIASNVITLGPIASTRMLCPDKQMAQEDKFLALLAGKVTKRYSVEGDLILTDEKGNRATLRQIF